jgi:hypothetical protein
MSKFRGLLDTARGREPEPESQSPEEAVTKQSAAKNQPVAKPEPQPKGGRPKGKRSHPDYEQITAYIRKDTHTAVKIALLEDSQKGEKHEFSELIQELLEQWLQSRI